MTNEDMKVIAGVDTHADTHHVALITEYGKHLADQKFLAVGSGYREIAEYITSYGPVIAVGIEGTGSYGAELARVLAKEGFEIKEVNRPNRAHRRMHGKSDPLDAYQAAESVLAERGTSTPKTRDGYVEALRVLRTARTSALKARTAVLAQISAVLAAAPEAVRAKYRGQTSPERGPAAGDGELIRLSLPEIRRLLVRLVWHRTTSPVQVLEHSTWRRKHQHRARYCHYKTRGHTP